MVMYEISEIEKRAFLCGFNTDDIELIRTMVKNPTSVDREDRKWVVESFAIQGDNEMSKYLKRFV
jgi:hypothetical protein